MNGSEPRIEIFKPFGEAFELMKKILFQPFDLRKWLVIGFAAWVANLGAGGGGIGNFNYPNNQREGAQKFNETISPDSTAGSHHSYLRFGLRRPSAHRPVYMAARTRAIHSC